MPTIHVYGLDHSRAPIEVREQLTFCNAELLELLPSLLAPFDPAEGGHVREAMVLSTCNRTEVYLVIDGVLSGYPLEPIRRYRPEARLLDDHCMRYHFRGQEAIAHLFAVSASLRSQVPGDTQISTQVVNAAEIARRAGTIGPVLERAVAAASRSAKRVRRETGLMAGGGGTGPVVLRNLRRLSSPQTRAFHPIRVVILGAGEMAGEIVTHLLRSQTASNRPTNSSASLAPRSADITIIGVWARDQKKCQAFAETYQLTGLDSRSLDRALASADAVIGACRGRVAALSERKLLPILEARVKPLLVIDVGVPRNLDPNLAGRDGLQTVFLDQLHQQMREWGKQKGDALKRGEQIVSEEAARCEEWLRRRPLQPMRAEMYNSLESVLKRWYLAQPGAVKQLRVSLHRSLDQAFRMIGTGVSAEARIIS